VTSPPAGEGAGIGGGSGAESGTDLGSFGADSSAPALSAIPSLAVAGALALTGTDLAVAALWAMVLLLAGLALTLFAGRAGRPAGT